LKQDPHGTGGSGTPTSPKVPNSNSFPERQLCHTGTLMKMEHSGDGTVVGVYGYAPMGKSGLTII